MSDVIANTVPAPDVPENWIEVTVGRLLRLRAPVGTYFEAKPGVDSYVGIIKGPGFELALDYGHYSDSLGNDADIYKIYQAHTICLDGKSARLIQATLTTGSEILGLNVADLGSDGLGTLGVTVIGILKQPQGLDLIRRVLESIRFYPPPHASLE